MIVDISFCELLITWGIVYYGVVGFSRYGGNDGAAYEMIGSSLMFLPRSCILVTLSPLKKRYEANPSLSNYDRWMRNFFA